MQWDTVNGGAKCYKQRTYREANYRGPSNRHSDRSLRVGQLCVITPGGYSKTKDMDNFMKFVAK